jgi:acetyltransferase-like isoleucine patch superfamily enzyme
MTNKYIKSSLQKLLGKFLDQPVILKGKTIGYSLIKSQKAKLIITDKSRYFAPFYFHDVKIGDYSYIAGNSRISNTQIGKFCSIGPNFCCGLGIHPINGISTSPMFYSTSKQNGKTLVTENKIAESRKTIIGNDVFIGANVTLLDGVYIGDGAVIGAGAVVTKDIPAYAVATGVPAKVVKYRVKNAVIEKIRHIEWWNFDEEKLKDIERYFFDIERFIFEFEKQNVSK